MIAKAGLSAKKLLMDPSKPTPNGELQNEYKRLRILYPFLPEDQIKRKAKEMLNKKKGSSYLRHESNARKGKTMLDFKSEGTKPTTRSESKSLTKEKKRKPVISTKTDPHITSKLAKPIAKVNNTKTIKGKATTASDLKQCGFMELGGRCFTNEEQLDIFSEEWFPKQKSLDQPRKNIQSNTHRGMQSYTKKHQEKNLCERLFDELVSRNVPNKDKTKASFNKDNIEIITISSDSEESDIDALDGFLTCKDKVPTQIQLNDIKVEDHSCVKSPTRNVRGQLDIKSHLEKNKPENDTRNVRHHLSKHQRENICSNRTRRIRNQDILMSPKSPPQTMCPTIKRHSNYHHVENQCLMEDDFIVPPSYEISVNEVKMREQALVCDKTTQTIQTVHQHRMSHVLKPEATSTSTQTEASIKIDPINNLHAIQEVGIMKKGNQTLSWKEDTVVNATQEKGYKKKILQAVRLDLLSKTLNNKTSCNSDTEDDKSDSSVDSNGYESYDTNILICNEVMLDSSDSEMIDVQSLQLQATQTSLNDSRPQPAMYQPNDNHWSQKFLLAKESSPFNKGDETLEWNCSSMQDSNSQIQAITTNYLKQHKGIANTSPFTLAAIKTEKDSYKTHFKTSHFSTQSSALYNILETFKDITGRIKQNPQQARWHSESKSNNHPLSYETSNLAVVQNIPNATKEVHCKVRSHNAQNASLTKTNSFQPTIRENLSNIKSNDGILCELFDIATPKSQGGTIERYLGRNNFTTRVRRDVFI